MKNPRGFNPKGLPAPHDRILKLEVAFYNSRARSLLAIERRYGVRQLAAAFLCRSLLRRGRYAVILREQARGLQSGSFATALQGSCAANSSVVLGQPAIGGVHQPVHLFLQSDHLAAQPLPGLPGLAESIAKQISRFKGPPEFRIGLDIAGQRAVPLVVGLARLFNRAGPVTELWRRRFSSRFTAPGDKA
jgi:hypothetical protein